MPTRIRNPRWLLPAATAAMVGGLAPLVRIPSPLDFGAFVAFVALGELLEVRLSTGATVSLGLAPALAYAFLGHGVPEVALCFTAGAALTALAGLVRRRSPSIEEISIRALVLGAASGAFVAMAHQGLRFGPKGTQISTLGLAAALAIVLVLGALLKSVLAAARERIPWFPLFVGTARTGGPMDLSAVSAGTLLALAYPVLGAWSFPLFLAPLIATHYSFRQLTSIQRTYLQTIRALSKVPEMAGYTRPGHSTRVAQLAVEVARELGMSDTSEIEYAALLHDIGRLSLPDPDPEAGTSHRLELALVGAAIVEETGHFPQVAAMIRAQHEPYRRRGEDTNRHLPPGAKIIKVVSAYDDLTRPEGLGRSSWDALERLHLGTAYDFDPAVIQALTKVLEKRREI